MKLEQIQDDIDSAMDVSKSFSATLDDITSIYGVYNQDTKNLDNLNTNLKTLNSEILPKVCYLFKTVYINLC